jgi:hypothetical protein
MIEVLNGITVSVLRQHQKKTTIIIIIIIRKMPSTLSSL